MHRCATTILATVVMTGIIAIGCSSPDDGAELAALAMQSADRQAEQNHQMADLQQEVAKGTQELVAADAAARKEMASQGRELQHERAEIGLQRDHLETERKQIAQTRHRDPLLAAAITHAAWIVACLLPLVVCIYLLRRPSDSADDSLVAEMLIEEFVAEEPLLLSRDSQIRALPGPVSPGGDAASDGPTADGASASQRVE